MNQTIHVAACCDENYIAYAGVMMISALEATPTAKIHFHLINCNIAASSLEKLENLVGERGGRLHIYLPNDDLYRGLPTLRYGEAVYQRINLPEYIPSDIDRLIYIDSDTLVLGDLNELWQTDLKGKLVAAVENLSPTACQDIGFARTEYFNSGLLLMDLDGWRKEKIHQQVSEYARDNAHRLQYVDQCSLNAVLKDRWLRLGPDWNQQSDIYKVVIKYHEGSSYSQANLQNAILNPSVVHFTGKKKPWKIYCFHPFKKRYQQVLASTPWANLRAPDDTLGNRLSYYTAFRQLWKCYRRRLALNKFHEEKTNNGS